MKMKKIFEIIKFIIFIHREDPEPHLQLALLRGGPRFPTLGGNSARFQGDCLAWSPRSSPPPRPLLLVGRGAVP